MDAGDVLSIVRCVVAACAGNPTASASEILAATARARGTDPADHVKVETHIEFRRSEPYHVEEVMTRARWKEFKRIAAKNDIDFGEINGKHSEVIRSYTEVVYRKRGDSPFYADEVALALLVPVPSINKGFLACWARNYDWEDDDASNKRAECEDAEVPAAKRIASSDS